MQNLQYNTAVAAIIECYANNIKNAAYDSVAEANDYSIADNCDKIQYLLVESAKHTTVKSLAVAALNSTLDTVVRECMYDNLMQHVK